MSMSQGRGPLRRASLPRALALAAFALVVSCGLPAFAAGDAHGSAHGDAGAHAAQAGKPIAQLVTIRPKPGMEAVLAERIMALAGPTRQESGTLRYDLYEKAGGVWLVLEYWADEAALAAHIAQPYSAAFLKDMGQFVEGNPQVEVFQRVDVAH